MKKAFRSFPGRFFCFVELPIDGGRIAQRSLSQRSGGSSLNRISANRTFPQDINGAVRTDTHHATRHSAWAYPAVDHHISFEPDTPQRFNSTDRRHRTTQVGAGHPERPAACRKQTACRGMIRHTEPLLTSVARQHQRQRTRPKARRQASGGGRQHRPARKYGGKISREQCDWLAGRAPLDRANARHRTGTRRMRRDAVNGVCRYNHHAACPQQTSRAIIQ